MSIGRRGEDGHPKHENPQHLLAPMRAVSPQQAVGVFAHTFINLTFTYEVHRLRSNAQKPYNLINQNKEALYPLVQQEIIMKITVQVQKANEDKPKEVLVTQDASKAMRLAWAYVAIPSRNALPKVTITAPSGVIPHVLNPKPHGAGMEISVLGNPHLGDKERTRRSTSYKPNNRNKFAAKIRRTPTPVRVALSEFENRGR